MHDPPATAGDRRESSRDRRLMILLAMAMFVLVVDTSLMNVSISAVVRDLDTTASGVQSAIALEALVSAAFILINSKIGDLIGRKRAYVLGLTGYAIGAVAMTLAQSLTAIIIFWAIIGGLGASLLLPAMQSLIHGNFTGAAQKQAYAMVGASAAIAAAVGPLLGGVVTTYLSWRVGFALEAVIIAVVLSRIKLIRDVPYTGSRRIDLVGALLSVLGMGGVVLGILVWQEGGERVGLLMAIGAVALAALAWWLIHRKRAQQVTLLEPDLFRHPNFTAGVTGQMLQQITLGGAMIALPLYFQMTLEYNAMEAGLSLAPLSLTMFAAAVIVGQKAGDRRPAAIIRTGFLLASIGIGIIIPFVPRANSGWATAIPLMIAGAGLGLLAQPVDIDRVLDGVPAQQLHPRPCRAGADQRGGRGELCSRLLRALVRARAGRRTHARRAVVHLHEPDREQRGHPTGPEGTDRGRARGPCPGHEQQRAGGADHRSAHGGGSRGRRHQRRRSEPLAPGRPPRATAGRARRTRQLAPDDAASRPEAFRSPRGDGSRLNEAAACPPRLVPSRVGRRRGRGSEHGGIRPKAFSYAAGLGPRATLSRSSSVSRG